MSPLQMIGYFFLGIKSPKPGVSWGKTAKVKWKELLAEVYKAGPNQYTAGPKIYFGDSNHALTKSLRISGQQISQALSFLETQKLIKRNIHFVKREPPEIPYHYEVLELTEKGFDVAKQNEQLESNNRFTEILTLATSLTALTAAINFMLQLISENPPFSSEVRAFLLFSLAIITVALALIFGGFLGKFIIKSYQLLREWQ